MYAAGAPDPRGPLEDESSTDGAPPQLDTGGNRELPHRLSASVRATHARSTYNIYSYQWYLHLTRALGLGRLRSWLPPRRVRTHAGGTPTQCGAREPPLSPFPTPGISHVIHVAPPRRYIPCGGDRNTEPHAKTFRGPSPPPEGSAQLSPLDWRPIMEHIGGRCATSWRTDGAALEQTSAGFPGFRHYTASVISGCNSYDRSVTG